MFGLRLSFTYFLKNINKVQIRLERKCHPNVLASLENPESNYNKEDVDYSSKIIYSEAITKVKKKPEVVKGPIFLNYISKDKNVESQKDVPCEPKITEVVFLPYEVKKKYTTRPNTDQTAEDVFSDSVTTLTPLDNVKLGSSESLWKNKNVKLYEKDFEKINILDYNNNDVIENDNIDDNIKFGTYDPKSPISSVPCGGCGALLHCCNPSIPGFLPQEVFKGKTHQELLGEKCQRCYFLKEFNVALGVNVCPSDYVQIISELKNKNALIIVLIDLLDFPCSIWPGLFELIGSKPIIIVGNKIDLFIQEGPSFLENIKECLLDCLKEQEVNLRNIKLISLISAKTGYGVEKLISNLHQHWGSKGDVYLIGSTNAGKSTLFNALINSDYCKVKAIDLLQRATVSAWPGTTLNLLKFPIMKPLGWKLFARTKRIASERKAEFELKKLQKVKNPRLEQIQLTGHIGRTFRGEDNVNKRQEFEFDCTVDPKTKVFDPSQADFIVSKWCYDTPGVVHDDQIINLFTTTELLLVIPKKMLMPRFFNMVPGLSLFVGGIARIDFLKGSPKVWFTVYASEDLPITIVKLEDADRFYKKFLGSEILRVPCGGKARLNKWPEMRSKKLELSGRIPNEAAGDIVLSSAGWVSVTLRSAHRCIVEVWTPEGRGIHLRRKPIIKQTLFFKGNQISNSLAFQTSIKKIKEN